MENLGFEPQKLVVYNEHLPYKELIKTESVAVLSEIKGELGRAVELRDIKYGATHWTDQLSRYIRVYGYCFSKEDHLKFIHLMYELVTIPDLELALVGKFASKLSVLLKKKELLTREDLELPWRPLYELCEVTVNSKFEPLGLHLLPSNIEGILKNLIRNCRDYFPLEATQEMLDEWRPLLCPFDVTILKALNYLHVFLPTNLPPEHHDKGFKLWFDEFWQMYDSYKSKPSWEANLVSIFSRLAYDNIGYIDWKPYIPKIFTRVLRSFNLPVGQQDARRMNSGIKMGDIDMNSVVTWIVAMIGPDRIALEHINKLFKALQTFYHPSNTGPWIVRLTLTLTTFPKQFVKRINRERYKKLTWERPVPDEYKINDDDITYFVESLKSCVFLAMFGKIGSQESAVAVRYLATLRPELIVPTLLEKMYPAMETLIEPHRLISCINCIVSVARPMLRSKKWYPEGPSHVLPLLNLALPGIDPNDFKKSLMTFQMLSTFSTLIPIIDCSQAVHVRTDLSEYEREICLATAQFEDFVLLFLDRVFTLIEASAQEVTSGTQSKLNTEQHVVEMGLSSTASSVFQQCSFPIYKSALKKIYQFVTSNVYETKVSGKFAANLCRAVTKVHPEEALKLFLPHFCDKIVEYLQDNEDAVNEEHLDNSFLWNLLMVSQIVRCDGKKLLPYSQQLIEVLKKTLYLRCQHGSEIAGQLLSHILKVLTQTFPLEFCSTIHLLEETNWTEHLPTRDWAAAGDLDNLDLKWHIPSAEEIQLAQTLFNQFLIPEVEMMKTFSSQTTIDRELLTGRLNIITQCIIGAGCFLPIWDGEALQLVDSEIYMGRFSSLNSTDKHEITLNGENTRKVIANAARHMLKEFIQHREDETKNLKKIVEIYEFVMMYYGAAKNDFDGRWKGFHLVKSVLEDKLRGKKNHIRAMLIDRIQLQHELRILHVSPKKFTSLHKEMLLDLFDLSVSHYSEVRKKSQSCLQTAFHHFPYSYSCIIQPIVDIIKQQGIPEHRFKGALYTILNPGNRTSLLDAMRLNNNQGSKQCLATKRNWSVLNELWPGLIQAQQSEKPTVLKVIDNIVLKVMKNLDTIAIDILVSDKCLESAKQLLCSDHPKPNHSPGDQQLLLHGQQSEANRNKQALQLYLSLVDKLVDIIESGKLTWKFVEVGMEFMLLLLRHDIPAPPKVVNLITKQLINDSLYVRKVGMSGVSAILKQQKRKHKMIQVDPYKRSNTTPPSSGDKINIGDRPDNSWHHYDSHNIVDTEEKWNNAAFVEKTHWGYHQWPKEMLVHAPPGEQPVLNRKRIDLSECEVIIYDHFQDSVFIDKLISYLSLEENKGRDKFRSKYLTLYKGLFRNYGICMLDIFKPHIERLILDTSHDKQHSSQRCGMEILAGAIRGAKHWSFQHVEELWKWAIPLLKTTISNYSIETVSDWKTFYSSITESRDPRKLSALYEFLLTSPLSGDGGAFGDSSRLSMILYSVIQQEWRIPEILHRILSLVSQHLSHQYKAVRDEIGSLLSNIYLYDYKLNKNVRSPVKSDFMKMILPTLDKLKDTVEVQTDEGTTLMEVDGSNSEEDRKEAIRLCKTVLKFLVSSNGRAYETSPQEILPLLPVICALDCESTDDDLVVLRNAAFYCLSHALLEESDIPHVIEMMREVTGLQSWHARKSILRYIQNIVFDNFFLLDNPHYKQQIQEILFHLICDEQLEVREMASVTFSGLLHCGFLQLEQGMMDHFEHLRRTKVKKRKLTQALPLDTLIKRHAGVLGLSACVQAYPYDVPEFVPQILMDLSVHVNDPQPIQLTVKKTLSDFRRTHHDNWLDHKQMFTDDQLVILTDLLISPNYYA